MPNFIIYVTKVDAEMIRNWINSDDRIAWIVKGSQFGHEYHWKAVREVEAISEQTYALWHIESGALNIPSGSKDRADAIVLDPFAGWVQTLESESSTRPWFGQNLPGPFSFSFKATGTESPGSIGRSEFSWLGNRYQSIGKPAPAASIKWWSKLGRYIRSSATEIPWPYPQGIGNSKAYAFPDAFAHISRGVPVDVNP
jgi:hypothetical protein